VEEWGGGHFEFQRRVIAPNLTLAASKTRADEKSDLPVYRLGPEAEFIIDQVWEQCDRFAHLRPASKPQNSMGSEVFCRV
jgi:hypothetical protein